ncbi:hypothetical protein QFC24_001050 [Naganishia onofrii]|uniref:Uncharacterized protein n=1 Tax=Naganishia onofrii TaxID=1851511 RepID=A0ACC2XVK4_9TREE|nr:hypothetical protein QFC24_001050 [Naganishia onofrii]
MAPSATVVLMPINWTRHGSTDSDTDVPANFSVVARHPHTHPGNVTHNPTLFDIIIDPQTTTSLHLIFTYFFSVLALYLLHKNTHRFLRAKQTFSIARKSTIPARTVLVSAIPRPLRSERALKEYFEHTCGWPVESVQVVRHVGQDLREAIRKRDAAMRQLEHAWWTYTGGSDKGRIRLEEDSSSSSPSRERSPTGQTSGASSLHPFALSHNSTRASSPSPEQDTETEIPVLIEDPEDPSPNWGEVRAEHELPETGHVFAVANETAPETQEATTHAPTRHRPTTRIGGLSFLCGAGGKKVDAITYWQEEFDRAHRRVCEIRAEHALDAEGDAGGSRDADNVAGDAAAEAEGRNWLTGWMGTKRSGAGVPEDGDDDDEDLARVRVTEEGRAVVFDHEHGRGHHGHQQAASREETRTHDGSRDSVTKSKRGQSKARAVVELGRDPWRPSGEAFVTFQSITSAVSSPSICLYPLNCADAYTIV